jgi:hypothetical protein
MLFLTKTTIISVGSAEFSLVQLFLSVSLEQEISIGFPVVQASVNLSLPLRVTSFARQRGALPSVLPDVPALVTRIFQLENLNNLI